MRESTKYPKEQLRQIVKESKSYAEVMRKLGKKWSGGQQQNLKRWIAVYEFDISHFTGQAHNKNKTSPKKKHWSEWLVLDESLIMRMRSHVLRNALIESGREYKCEECGQESIWRGKKLKIQIDHKNGNWKDNRETNLQFLCPNCHHSE